MNISTTNGEQSVAGIRGFMVPLHCEDLVPTMQFFIERLGFRIDAIFPADSPRTAILSGKGLTVLLRPGKRASAEELHLLCDDPGQLGEGVRELIAPNGVKVRLTYANPPMQSVESKQELSVSLQADGTPWTVGRAGLRYRDLLPGRHGGAFVASHIRILEGGPVPDYVHYHKARFQVIFCRKGWVRVAYEGQGDPFVLSPGDCVLQPTMIRHRVLESSAGAEVVEIGSPAEHITMADQNMVLPNGLYAPDHKFEGQRFVRFIAEKASWEIWKSPGFIAADTGIGEATNGLGGVRLVRPKRTSASAKRLHATEFCLFFILNGSLTVTTGSTPYALSADDSIVIPGNTSYSLDECSADLEMLEVTLPADFDLSI
ncbi:cupin [Cupriavidus sp. AcVe19-6a]|uniref:cupin domain-containing protein n=1 Tax=Cupriavidus sp. AcVe19-6a TaxID=2821358 RepID=UPI001AE8952C|nr:cupin [Cupriavidus sp. AcVe19-6a]MBP0640076.1 cupin [Cupriavidus sp. AcVe19-6a]